MAAKSKWRITANPAAALAVATELLNDEEFWLIAHAAGLLGEIGPTASPALPDLQRLVTHDHDYVRTHVQMAIDSILA